MGNRPVVAAVVLAALLATATTVPSVNRPKQGRTAPVDRGAYCVRPAGVPVGNICVMVG